MQVGRAYDLDELAEMSGIAAPRLLPRLSELELDGRICRAAGGAFPAHVLNVLVSFGAKQLRTWPNLW